MYKFSYKAYTKEKNCNSKFLLLLKISLRESSTDNEDKPRLVVRQFAVYWNKPKVVGENSNSYKSMSPAQVYEEK